MEFCEFGVHVSRYLFLLFCHSYALSENSTSFPKVDGKSGFCVCINRYRIVLSSKTRAIINHTDMTTKSKCCGCSAMHDVVMVLRIVQSHQRLSWHELK